MNVSMKLVYKYMAIFFNFSPTSNHLHPLQVENCDSNSRLVVDEDDNGKFRLERVKALRHLIYIFTCLKLCLPTATYNFKWMKNTYDCLISGIIFISSKRYVFVNI